MLTTINKHMTRLRIFFETEFLFICYLLSIENEFNNKHRRMGE